MLGFYFHSFLKFVSFDLSQSTFEEYRLNDADVGDKTKWLKEGMDCNLLFWNGKVIPNFLRFGTLFLLIYLCANIVIQMSSLNSFT